jgi:NAD(P)-dependent dehydrogenase (short-subunit alcohol dehydrogenase family)
MQPQRLKGKVAVVTGASRGVGRGIALVLGEEGATVYVTGRSSREGQTTLVHDRKGKSAYHSGTVEESAELVTARGGIGIARCVDHRVDEQVGALFERVKQEQGRIDILVNNVWGGYENMEKYNVPLWEQPLWRWDAMFDAGSRAHFVASRFAIPLMLPQRQGLIVNTTYPWYPSDRDRMPKSIQSLSKWTVNGLVCMLAHQLRKYNVAAVGLAPGGWVWSEWHDTLKSVYDALRTSGNLSELVHERPGIERPDIEDGESPEYTGRAVVALALDLHVMKKTGLVLPVPDLAREYGFTDIDGRQPLLRY